MLTSGCGALDHLPTVRNFRFLRYQLFVSIIIYTPVVTILRKVLNMVYVYISILPKK
jgi:hypothetical protein